MFGMHLTLHTDYALRTLLYLTHREALVGGRAAGRGPGAGSAGGTDRVSGASRPATVDDIAAAFSISREHLVKVVQKLARLGYLATRSGRGGAAASISTQGTPNGVDWVRHPGVQTLSSGGVRRRGAARA